MQSIFKKIFYILIIFLGIFSISIAKPQTTFAHPIDITDLYLYYGKEADGAAISSEKISGYLYINWYQAAALIQEATGKNAMDLDMEELVKYDDIYQPYIKNNLTIENNGKACETSFITIPQDSYAYPLDLGKRIIVNFKCVDELKDLKIKNTLFLKEFEFSTNYINFFKGEAFVEKIEMNANFTESSLTIKNDGIQIEKPEDFISTDGAISPLDPEYKNQNFTGIEKKNESWLKSAQNFIEGLKKIGNVSEMNPFYLFLILFLLGFLHTLEAGHSKVVLTSAMIHKKMSIKGGVLYAIIFTATHIGDILLLGLSLLVVNNFVDVYSKFSMLEKFAAYSLLFIGVYLLFKSVSDFVQMKFFKKDKSVALGHNHTHDGHAHDDGHDHSHGEHGHSHEFDPHKSFKDQLLVGFLTGLAPCVFGWSVLMVIVSAKKLWLLIPAILSFSLGIFTALVLVVFLIGKFRNKLFSKIGWLTEISPIISALILIAYAVYIIS